VTAKLAMHGKLIAALGARELRVPIARDDF
jgi:hypothetical protein